MKKKFFLAAAAALILIIAIVPTSALSPVYQNGNPNKSGSWSPYTGYVKGFFSLDRSVEDLFTDVFPMTWPAQIYRDERDSEGNGLCFYIMNMSFAEGIGLNSSSSMPYDTISMIFREYDSSGEGYLNDLGVAIAGTDTYVSLFHTDGTLESTFYQRYHSIFFGFSGLNSWIADEYGNEALFDWYTTLLSGPIIDGQVQVMYGIFVPVVYTFGVIEGGSSGGGSSGGVITPPSSGSDSDAASSFGAFFGLIVSSFNSLLSIEFFGGLFALRDIVGLVIVLALLTLFLRWFAGG